MSVSRRQILAATAATALSSWPVASSAGFASPMWRQCKGDARRTGRSRFHVPLHHKPLWNTNRTHTLQSSMSVGADGLIYTAGDNGILRAFEPTGEVRWLVGLGAYVTAGTAILLDGSILALPESGVAQCFRRSGAFRWTFDTGDYTGPHSAPLVAGDGSIYIGHRSALLSLRPNGHLRWRLDGLPVDGPPAEGPDGTIYLPSREDLVAVSPAGKVLWRCDSGVGTYGLASAPAVGDDGTIYVNGRQGQLLAVNPDGTQRWKAGEPGQAADVPASPALGLDGTIYHCSSYQHINAVDPDGTLRWRYSSDKDDRFSSPTVCADGAMLVGTWHSSKVIALSAAGELLWEQVIDAKEGINYVRTAPVPMKHHRLLVGSFEGMFVLGPRNNP
ncbi:outer membrane protein assembly factor BamB family protein [Ideonella sp. YS5]|uniref:outer membrane protein assembly factor BamB family protein n=1 Tax=Ideonella sp. YS5 TaxID=3453714 RepID=UPI003EED60E9